MSMLNRRKRFEGDEDECDCHLLAARTTTSPALTPWRPQTATHRLWVVSETVRRIRRMKTAILRGASQMYLYHDRD